MSTETLTTPDELWSVAKNELARQMTPATFNKLLIDAILIEQHNQLWRIGVRNEYAADWLRNRLKDTVVRTLTAVTGSTGVEVEFIEVAHVNGNGRMPHHTTEDAAAIRQAIEARQSKAGVNGSGTAVTPQTKRKRAPGAGRKKSIPKPPVDRFGKVEIKTKNTKDPTYGYIVIPHYAERFWQPLVGSRAFSLWQTLLSYAFYHHHYGTDMPTIQMLSATLGVDRVALLGRDACNGRKAQAGAVQILEQHGICTHTVIPGKTKQLAKHEFEVEEKLPILTPYQVAQLPEIKKEEHVAFLKFYPDFNMYGWERLKAKSLLLEKVRGW